VVTRTALLALALECLGVGEVASQSVQGTKRALLIAIGEYGVAPTNPITGRALLSYRQLSSANDAVLVRGALEHQGFLPRNIRVLPDSQATAAGIRAGLQRLVRETERGDVVVIHYSGHGHRITNDNPDRDAEIDGYDEVLVPYGAPAEFYEGYDGSLHIRDDEIGDFIAQIRARAGAAGNLTVFLDACYSGTATRGPGGEDLPSRGEETPLGPENPPRATRGGGDDDRGTGIELARASGTRGDGEDLAAYAVFSAASPRQMAKETYDVDGRTKVGSLSYAIARALPEAGPGTTNRALFAAITRSLLGKVYNQTPQLEGDADRAVFSNRLTQQVPYVVVDSVVAEGMVLAGGTLIGLNPGTQLAVHPLGTSTPERSNALATVRVIDATPTRAIAEVLSGAGVDATRGAWAFVTQRSFGDLALRVRLDPSLAERDREGLSRLAQSGMVQLVEEGAEVHIVAGQDGRPEARAAADDRVLGSGAQRVQAAVEDFARNRYLRRLRFDSAELDIVLEISPGARILQDAAGESYCSAADWVGAEARPENLGGGQWRLRPGDAYWLRANNVGRERAYVYLVDLRPGGQVDVMWPETGRSGEELDPGRTIDFGCYQISADDFGDEVLKLFATGTPQDLRPTFQSVRTRAAAPDQALSREVTINIQPNLENRE
jgi:hypothetical protein